MLEMGHEGTFPAIPALVEPYLRRSAASRPGRTSRFGRRAERRSPQSALCGAASAAAPAFPAGSAQCGRSGAPPADRGRGTADRRGRGGARLPGPVRQRAGRREPLARRRGGLRERPGHRGGAEGPDPTAVLQPHAEEARRGSGVDFIAVMSTDGIRYTDTDPSLIGRRAPGTSSARRPEKPSRRSSRETRTTRSGPWSLSGTPRAPSSAWWPPGSRSRTSASAVDRQLPLLFGAPAPRSPWPPAAPRW